VAVNAVLTIAFRDLVKLLKDRTRLLSSFIFPFVLIALLGGMLQAGLGGQIRFNLISFTFTGVYIQTLFQSSALGVISLLQDRENDFTQELFVSPISRYSIVFGKILGESLVSMVQGAGIIVLGLVLGVHLGVPQIAGLAVVGLASCLVGGAFGIVILANLSSQRVANQLFPFVFLPQFFLAGVFAPIQGLPVYLEVLSRASPLRYPVDLLRGVFYSDQPEYSSVVVDSLALNLAVMAAMFAVFLVAGTWLFVRNERNR
jgi:ABC-2 type transport system permease protein